LFAYTPVQLYYSLIELKDGKKDENVVGRKILAMNTVKTITACFGNVDDLEFSYKEEDEKFYIKSSIGTARFGLLYDDMPLHYKDNVSTADLNKVKLDRRALMFILESISQALASWDQLVLVTVAVEQKMVHLKVVNNDLPAEARESLAIEETDLTESFSIGIPSASVIKCLRNLDDSHIEMYFSSSDKPVFIKGCESDFSVGFMPFRI
jgi:DNA polymerase III sliding clamp (beta) subunit (PCNA family)